jgi:hypothetical protein
MLALPALWYGSLSMLLAVIALREPRPREPSERGRIDPGGATHAADPGDASADGGSNRLSLPA